MILLCGSCGTINTFYLQGDMSQYDFTTTLEKDKTKQKQKTKKQTNKKSTTFVIQKAAIILHELSEPKKLLCVIIFI